MAAGIVLSVAAAAVAYISCEAAQRLKLADSAKLFALTFLLVTFGARDGISELSTQCLSCMLPTASVPNSALGVITALHVLKDLN